MVLPRTEQRTLQSSHIDVAYKLYVSLPNGYDTATVRYPVIYLLDADYSFAITHNIVEHLSDRAHLRAAIIVGIAYDGPAAYRRNRTRDYTPTHVGTGGYGAEIQKVSGGGPLFRRFIADELIPFIAREYRVNDERVLVGHSYGGLFAAWLAVKNPQLFGALRNREPVAWRRRAGHRVQDECSAIRPQRRLVSHRAADGMTDHLIFKEERRLATTSRDLPARVYLAVGWREVNNQRDMVADLRRFAATLEQRKYPGLRLRWSVEDDETHNSVFPGALSDGLRFVLEGL